MSELADKALQILTAIIVLLVICVVIPPVYVLAFVIGYGRKTWQQAYKRGKESA